MRHFTRYYNGVAIYDAAGKPIVSTKITETLHEIVSDDPDVLKALDKFIKADICGIIEVSAHELADLKKKASLSPPLRPSHIGGPQVAMDTSTPSLPPSAPDVAGVGSSMLPLAEEVAAIRSKPAAKPVVEKEIPPPTPPVVGRRSHHKAVHPHDPS